MNKGKGNQEAMALIKYIPAQYACALSFEGQGNFVFLYRQPHCIGKGNACPYSIGQGNQDKGKRINAYA